MSTLLPNHEAKDENDITAGQLLCGGLFASDCLSNWLSAVALTHGMIDQEGLKTELLKVQVASIQQAGGKHLHKIFMPLIISRAKLFRILEKRSKY